MYTLYMAAPRLGTWWQLYGYGHVHRVVPMVCGPPHGSVSLYHTLYPRYLWYTLSLYMYRMYGYGHVVVVGMVHVTVYHVHGGVY